MYVFLTLVLGSRIHFAVFVYVWCVAVWVCCESECLYHGEMIHTHTTTTTTHPCRRCLRRLFQFYFYSSPALCR